MKIDIVKKNYSDLYDKICYTFENDDLLTNALSHPSLCHSRRNKCMNYERLELLGDSVLSLIVLELLLDKYKHLDEGEIATRKSYLVCTKTLSEIGKSIGLGKYIYMTKGEEKSDGRNNPKIIENVMEAIIGAIYVDSKGLEKVKPLIEQYWVELINKQTNIVKDPKTRLQEWLQKNKQQIPEYILVEQSGSPNSPMFEMEIIIENFPSIKAKEKTKKTAEVECARKMVEYIKENIDDKI